jgi:hypothetical protein
MSTSSGIWHTASGAYCIEGIRHLVGVIGLDLEFGFLMELSPSQHGRGVRLVLEINGNPFECLSIHSFCTFISVPETETCVQYFVAHEFLLNAIQYSSTCLHPFLLLQIPSLPYLLAFPSLPLLLSHICTLVLRGQHPSLFANPWPK